MSPPLFAGASQSGPVATGTNTDPDPLSPWSLKPLPRLHGPRPTPFRHRVAGDPFSGPTGTTESSPWGLAPAGLDTGWVGEVWPWKPKPLSPE